MKKVSLSLLLIGTFMAFVIIAISRSFGAGTVPPTSYAQPLPEELAGDTTLHHIEVKIKQAFVQCMVGGQDSPLTDLMATLEAKSDQYPHNLLHYWQSYLQYYHCIYFLNVSDEKQAKATIQEAIDRLDQMKDKNAEDYALLAMTQSMSIQFKSPMRAPFISNQVKKNAGLALASDSTNIRAHYVLASNDFYTPKQYGGGQIAEAHLLKAIQYPTQPIPNPMLPAWGQEESHEMLVQYYIREERWDAAKSAFQTAIAAYPDNYMLAQMSTKLVGK